MKQNLKDLKKKSKTKKQLKEDYKRQRVFVKKNTGTITMNSKKDYNRKNKRTQKEKESWKDFQDSFSLF